MPSRNGDGSALGGLGAYEDSAITEDRPADFVPSLVSLGFFKAALRRSAWFWCLAAVAGLIVGLGAYLVTPHPYQASTTLLLPLGPNTDISTQTATSEVMADNQATAQSRPVAGLVIRNLELRQSVSSFLSSYSTTAVTDRVFVITASASSSDQAVLRANAVATAFLQVRADELLNEQKLTRESLEQQIGQVNQDISSFNSQISRLSAESVSPAQQSQLSSLQAKRSQETTTLTALKQALVSEQTNTQPTIAADAEGAVVLSGATPLPHSRLKPLLLYAVIGLLAGVVLGVGVVLIRTLVSDRLRQRDDIAQALGAPVKLSVARVPGPSGADRLQARRRPGGRSRRRPASCGSFPGVTGPVPGAAGRTGCPSRPCHRRARGQAPGFPPTRGQYGERARQPPYPGGSRRG